MVQRPSFDLTRISTADKILLGGSLLMFIDTLLPWQRLCIDIPPLRQCFSSNAWGGNGAFAGVLLGLFTIALIIGEIMLIAGVAMPPNIPVPTVLAGVTLGTVLFALIKFLIVVGKAGAYGAWIGLVLAVVIAYGGYMKMQETRALPPPGDAGFTE
jgi:hypothetical protein